MYVPYTCIDDEMQFYQYYIEVKWMSKFVSLLGGMKKFQFITSTAARSNKGVTGV